MITCGHAVGDHNSKCLLDFLGYIVNYAADLTLVEEFITEYCPRLAGSSGNESLVLGISSIIRSFNWNDIEEAILNLTIQVPDWGIWKSEENIPRIDVEMTLRVIGGLDRGPAQQKLLTLAVDKAAKLDSKELQHPGILNLLWKWTIRTDDSKIFGTVATKCSKMDSSQLGPVIEALLVYIGELAPSDGKVDILKSLMSKRIEWLKQQIEGLDR
ncbi:hypothetical protein L917_12265 [Phytophthora nicotianae]|uniref:Uncharacterized protein n=2 Tax=Phytophthora nicotianae TaxID=4792 RepID=W2PYB6_PHYN3|nr:hypothetical protein PPTG_14340 [Phytophthora nicotianae INRA-310]ETL88677.1 hypothetical protein L917_12265 [Phytophthora nicotianae]ETN05651.1 hypothetical protein PPTG_14340 [Phytophthora nicotianae INRA-310]